MSTQPRVSFAPSAAGGADSAAAGAAPSGATRSAATTQPAAAAAAAPASRPGVLARSSQNHQARESNPASAPLSCGTCRETFTNVQELRRHFDSQHHVYNIRARVEGQPTLDRAEFRRKIIEEGGDPNAALGSGSAADSAVPMPVFTCNLCKRTYKSAQTLQSHLKSTEHLMRKQQKIMERQSNAGSVLSSTSLGSAAMGLHRRHKAHRHHQPGTNAANQLAVQQARLDQQRLAMANAALERARAGGDEAGGGAAAGPAGHHHVDPTVMADVAQLVAITATAAPTTETVIAEDGRVVTRTVQAAPRVSAEDREADVTPTRCLFCGFKSASVNGNLKHMLEVHQFTIPFEDRCSDRVALLEYLCRKVNGCVCLICGEKTKRYQTLEALRGHMRSANHERIELGAEYQDFYEGTALRDADELLPSVKPVRDEATGELVLRTATGATIRPGDGHPVRHGRLRAETAEQREMRHLITATRIEENALIVRERQALEMPRQKEEQKIAARARRERAHHDMKLSIQQNRMHPYGYDGQLDRS